MMSLFGCFNPLAGIRCFLTRIHGIHGCKAMYLFQSPSGDSLFSDRRDGYVESAEFDQRFNPLAGIRCFLTELHARVAENKAWGFQSPSGDSLFSDHSLGYHGPATRDPCFNPLAGIRCFLTIFSPPEKPPD